MVNLLDHPASVGIVTPTWNIPFSGHASNCRSHIVIAATEAIPEKERILEIVTLVSRLLLASVLAFVELALAVTITLGMVIEAMVLLVSVEEFVCVVRAVIMRALAVLVGTVPRKADI